jgi:hypothetical protein
MSLPYAISFQDKLTGDKPDKMEIPPWVKFLVDDVEWERANLHALLF